MSVMVPAKINDRWELVLPDFRRDFHAERPWWEAGRLAVMSERVEPGMCVYDVGAEAGDFTVLYKGWAGDGGSVVPIEPAPAMWPCIRETWRANGWVDSDGWFAGFASDVTAEPSAKFYEGDLTLMADGWPTMALGKVVADPGFRHLAQQTNHTAQVRLDDLGKVIGVPMPDVVVLDVEGAEFEALRGSAGLMIVRRPLFFVSVHDIGEWNSLSGWYGRTVEDIHQLMAGFDYTGTLLPENGEGEHFYLYEPD
jgi:FkbM family methyltransferase